MKKYLEIAKYLGVAVPACVFSIEAAQAADNQTEETDIHAKYSDNEVMSLLTKAIDSNSPEGGEWLIHTDSHTDFGGNHSDRHTNRSHSDYHANRDAKESSRWVTNSDGTRSSVPYCEPHSDRHTNSNPVNNHTNSGNEYHTNNHSDRNSNLDC